MTDAQQREAAEKFAERWSKKEGTEKSLAQTFWIELLHDVYGVENPSDYITFEEQVHLDHASFIDGYIPAVKVMIEQKKRGKRLNSPIRQSDDTFLSPFQQAKRYITELPVSEHPRWIITCNFDEFWIYDMEKPQGEPAIVRLADLPKEYYRLQFLVDKENERIKREEEVSIKAGEIVGLLHDAFTKQYRDPTSERSMRSLNILCVRLVFCLYAENAGIFGPRSMFHDYLVQYDARDMRQALYRLFKILDQKIEDRDPYLADEHPELAAFPYVNGGLFSEEDIEIPPFTDEIKDLLLEKASEGFDWHTISPTIFGAVFESTLNPATRRSGGMHYTSIKNIHKVIDPLFLDALKAERDEILALPNPKKGITSEKEKKLENFQKKLASLSFLDPACGSGNFLTETYLSLRSIENQIISELRRGQIEIGDADIFSPIQVKISQFYGIEINDFAVSVAKTALWIAESQMMQATERIVKMPLDFLPLKTNANIHEGNALTTDWGKIVPREKVNYIIGNPPFVGYSLQTKEQKDDLQELIPDVGKNIDYVTGWYFKAAELMQGTNARAALVSTNSITQGEQVAGVWKPLFERFKIHIDFAHRTFRWDSEASLKAHVHCVIVGFSIAPNSEPKVIYDSGAATKAENINAYLTDAPDVFIERRNKPICPVPEMNRGSQPTDDGNLILTEEEKEQLLKKEPQAAPLIRPFMMGKDFIDRKPHYCLWLVDADPGLLKRCPQVRERIDKVREFRLRSKKAATRQKADTPTLFDEIRDCHSDYLAVPETSSEKRRYIPIGFLNSSVLCSNAIRILPEATLYHFGILTSNVHMAWMRAVCGRLETRYRYSNTVVYNNFPWPKANEKQRENIERAAQAILDARAKFPDSSLADLYDELTMPPALRSAHQENDRAVMEAYGFSVRDMLESDCVAELMKLYAEKTKSEKVEGENAAAKK